MALACLTGTRAGVYRDGHGTDYVTITNAVADSIAGDTILVSTGLYEETVRITDTRLTIDGGYNADCTAKAGSGSTVIDGPYLMMTSFRCMVIATSTVKLIDLDLSGGGVPTKPGNGGGLHISGSSMVTADTCRVHNNSANGIGGGIYLEDSHLTLLNCAVYSNVAFAGAGAAGEGGGIGVDFGHVLAANNTEIYTNRATARGGGIFLTNSSTAYLTGEGTKLQKNHAADGGGLYAGGNSIVSVINGTDFNANAALTNGGGLYIDENSAGYLGGGSGNAYIGPAAFPNRAVNGSGGGAYVYGGSLYVSNGMTFACNTAADNGGAIALQENAYCEIDECTIGFPGIGFSTTASNGAGIHVYASTLNMKNGSRIYNCHADNDGGAIYAQWRSRIALSNGVLIGHSNTNYANAATDGQGGGIYSFLSDISISSSTCLNNRAKNAHGGGYYGQNSVLGADRCVFQENAANYGGGIYLVNVGAELVETTIFSNRCGVYGGGIRVAGNSNLVLRSIPALNYNTALDGGAIAVDQISGRVTIDAVTCCWNRATRDGGALFVNPGDVHLNACTFNNNQADNDSDGEGNGGGIWVGSNAVVTLTCTGNNMYVNNNQAPDGGGIQVEDTASVILSSPDSPPNYIFLVSNTATNRGGGIHVAGGTLDGTGYINFGNNDAVDGGGLYVSSNCSVRLSGTNSASPYFYLNRAESNGGGICAEGAGATVSLYNVRIGYPNLTNRATHYGGGIAVLDDARLECVNCEIRHNLSINSGGGIYAEDAMVEIRSDNAMATEDMRPLNRFEENEALSHGGGLCNISSKIIMGDVLFSSNSASRGGALYSGSFGTTLVYNALMVFNDASLTGEAVRVYGIGSHAVILQSTIADNGPGHPALAVSTDDALYMTNCIVENHISANQTVNYSDVEDGYPGTGNISDNPMFIDEMTGDYRPAYGSPVINQGIAINGITNDCINAQRPVGLYDMGAYEYNAQTYDSDYDTMIDIWETTFSLDPNNAADALLDTDGDGSTNLYEFIADTSPQNSNDYFRVLNISRAGTTNYVTVPSSTRREYTLYLCPSLDTGAWVQVSGQTNITGTGSPMALEDTGSMTLRHYRAQVIRP